MDARLWGFTICIDGATARESGYVSGFGTVLASEYGSGDQEFDLQVVGARKGECRRYMLENPGEDFVSRIEMHWNEVIVGLAINVGDRYAEFGQMTGTS